jgi:hypothetical protein
MTAGTEQRRQGFCNFRMAAPYALANSFLSYGHTNVTFGEKSYLYDTVIAAGYGRWRG